MDDINSTSKSFYVYVHRRASDGRVFYVGKGSGLRAWDKKSRRSNHWNRIANKYGYTVEIVQKDMLEWWSFELEIELIAFYGLENLSNSTNGGEGSSGYVFTKEDREKLSAKGKGRIVSQSTKDKLSLSQKGKSRNKSSIDKMIITKSLPHVKAKMQGDNNPMKKQETKDKLSKIFKGKLLPKISGSNHYLAKKVICIELDIEFDAMINAVNWLKKNGFQKAATSPISKCCNPNGSYKSAYGFTWKYA